jgi:hypothetical protein
MPLSTIPQAAIDAVLLIVAPFFLQATGGDIALAREAASLTLADYNIESQEELRLATEVISFSFQVLQALSQAAEPGIPIGRQLRLRGGAVSLRRSEKLAQDKLDQLQRARRATLAEPAPAVELQTAILQTPTPAAEPTPDQVRVDKTLELLEFARDMVKTNPPTPVKTTPRALRLAEEKRRMAQRMAESARRRAEENQRQEASKAAAAQIQPAPA